MNTETVTGIAASVCTAVSLIPQLVKVLKEKRSGSVSLWMLLVLFIGLGLWICYGVLKADTIIIISNAVSFIINLLLAFFAIKYKSR